MRGEDGGDDKEDDHSGNRNNGSDKDEDAKGDDNQGSVPATTVPGLSAPSYSPITLTFPPDHTVLSAKAWVSVACP